MTPDIMAINTNMTASVSVHLDAPYIGIYVCTIYRHLLYLLNHHSTQNITKCLLSYCMAFCNSPECFATVNSWNSCCTHSYYSQFWVWSYSWIHKIILNSSLWSYFINWITIEIVKLDRQTDYLHRVQSKLQPPTWMPQFSVHSFSCFLDFFQF